MPSKYLYLSDLQSVKGDDNVVTWKNLPVISESRRECYINVVHSAVVFGNSSASDDNEILVKINLPNINYFTSSNTAPVMAYLHSIDKTTFEQTYESHIKLLSNDGLKKVEVQLTNNKEEVINLTKLESISLVLKIDYIDKVNMTNEYLSQMPSLLG
jgi:hypothetical protein